MDAMACKHQLCLIWFCVWWWIHSWWICRNFRRGEKIPWFHHSARSLWVERNKQMIIIIEAQSLRWWKRRNGGESCFISSIWKSICFQFGKQRNGIAQHRHWKINIETLLNSAYIHIYIAARQQSGVSHCGKIHLDEKHLLPVGASLLV